MSEFLLGKLSPQRFLEKHWQKSPLLVKSAFPDFVSPLTADELAGLACEPGANARIVMETGGATPWEVRYGPFNNKDFAGLPKTHWTLLVTDTEKQRPVLQELLEPFRFIPDWRIDDLMISYAAPHGSTGPHVDEYDVFLLQAEGSRTWQISEEAFTTDDFIEDIELRILKNFKPQQQWRLTAGDMLYLPPGVAHYGIADEASMTFSIGFRAPSHQDLLNGWLEEIVHGMDPAQRYRDGNLETCNQAGEISAAARNQVARIIQQHLSTDPAAIERWFGRHITDTAVGEDEHEVSTMDIAAALRARSRLTRHPGVRFAWFITDGSLYFFADGEEYILPRSLTSCIEVLCRCYTYDLTDMQTCLQNAEFISLLDALRRRGLLCWDDERKNLEDSIG